MEGDAELDSLLDGASRHALQGFTAAADAATSSVAPPSGGSSRSATQPLAFDPMAAAAAPSRRAKKPPKAAKQRAPADEQGDDDATGELTAELSRLIAHLSQGAQQADGGAAGTEDIRATMAALEAQTRFTTGSLGHDAGAGPSDSLPPDMDEAAYQAMLQQFEQMGADPAMASMLDTMMAQLLSKEVLYEPLQQICARYPGWLALKRGVIPETDHARYTRQSALVAQLLAVFDHAPDDRGRVMQLMLEMQACGAPPQEIMSELAPGLSFNGDGTPQFPPEAAAGVVPPELAQSCAQM